MTVISPSECVIAHERKSPCGVKALRNQSHEGQAGYVYVTLCQKVQGSVEFAGHCPGIQTYVNIRFIHLFLKHSQSFTFPVHISSDDMHLYRPGRRRKSPSITLTTTLALLPLGYAFKLPWPFPAKRFTGNSLIDAGTMGLSGDNRVVAFGDFNGDQLYAQYLLTA